MEQNIKKCNNCWIKIGPCLKKTTISPQTVMGEKILALRSDKVCLTHWVVEKKSGFLETATKKTAVHCHWV